jgi:hypothetical protein
LHWIAACSRSPLRLALALPGPGTELFVFGELAQDFHVDPVWALLQDLLASGRDLRDPACRAVQQPGLGQMGNRPGDTISEQGL